MIVAAEKGARFARSIEQTKGWRKKLASRVGLLLKWPLDRVLTAMTYGHEAEFNNAG